MALSNSERQARHRDKRDAEIEALRNAPDNPELVAARKEIDALRNTAKAPSTDSPELIAARKEIERLRSDNAALWALHTTRQAKTAARKAKTAAADATAAEKYADDDRATLLEKIVQADKQLATGKTRIKNLELKVSWLQERFPPRMSRQLYRQVLGFLHPDRAHNDEEQRLKLEKVFQEFSVIKFTFPPPDDGTPVT
jgi:hypothetical protein